MASWKTRALDLLQEVGTRPEFDTDTSDGPEGWDSAMREGNLATVRTYSPLAAYTEEVRVRLHGEGLETHGLRPEWSQLLPPVEDTLNDLAGREIEVELSELTAGSTVLHFRSRLRPLLSEANEDHPLPVPFDYTVLSEAANKLIEVLSRVEASRPVLEWRGAVGHLSKFAGLLEKFNLNADFTWASPSGRLKSSSLTDDGIAYLHRLKESRPKTDVITASGRVTELRESGFVKIKTGTARNAPVYDVSIPGEALLAKRLHLGQEVHWKLQKTTETNALDEITSTEYSLIEEL